MKRILFALLLALALADSALAASFTITYTAAQDTTIQTRIIPGVNTTKCASFGLPPTCTSAQLVTRGCVAVAFPAKNYLACTIYTADAAGEGVFLQDESNRIIVDRFLQLGLTDFNVFRTSCLVATAAQKAQACTDVGAPATCNPCP